MTLCLSLGCAVAACDCAGSGQSDGQYVSLGQYEADDALAVVDYLKLAYGLRRYALWGRSMGAVTSLLYASNKAPDAAALVCDSPFASIKRLCHEFVHKAAPKVPNGAVTLAVRKIRRSVMYRTQFDIYDCKPELRVASSKAPALLIHGADDNFIHPSHSDSIAKSYGGKCLVLHPSGNHNAKRPLDIFLRIEAFLSLHLCGKDVNSISHKIAKVEASKCDHSRAPNPYLFPPWSYQLKEYEKSSVEVKVKQVRGHSALQAHLGKCDDAEFTSGMSEERQKQAEGAVSNLFTIGNTIH